MNEFDKKAFEWDKNPMRIELSTAIANEMIKSIDLNPEMRALEFGAGTGILSFLLKEHFWEIILMDTSVEMLKVTNEKIQNANASNMKTVFFNLENQESYLEKFDIIYTQMVLHHIENIQLIFDRFSKLLVPQGLLVIADLFAEDGSFHDASFKGHNGFNIDELTKQLNNSHFDVIFHKRCFTIKRINEIGEEKEFPVFLLASQLTN
jgi:ubiquinone/menaquinone biosynthesis C-methylase UbiE